MIAGATGLWRALAGVGTRIAAEVGEAEPRFFLLSPTEPIGLREVEVPYVRKLCMPKSAEAVACADG